ncbi:hypothetical protein [Pollutibacter soli]|uniref:hypothetical protein n=1 Tax=Pollutibacter soli TaxID=3034157 RepID=UPI0030139713
MKGFENLAYMMAYIVSNLAAIVLLLTAWKTPRISRFLFFLLFAWAGWVNWRTAHNDPNVYLEYAEMSFLKLYSDFILGWFSRHITAVISTIAISQLMISISMLLKGRILKLGCIAAIVFLLAIAPLGIGSAFPFSLIASAALLFILRNKTNNYLWVNHKLGYARH